MIQAVFFELETVSIFDRTQLQQIIVAVDLIGFDAAVPGKIAHGKSLSELIPKRMVVVIENIFIVETFSPFRLHKVLAGFNVDIHMRYLVGGK